MSAAGRRGVELLLEQGWSFHQEGRYSDALRAAERAREGAKQVGAIGLEVRAARLEAGALARLGRKGDALGRDSWVLGIAEDPAHRRAVADEDVAYEVLSAFLFWVESALHLPAIQVDRLFEVLDAGERFARGIGKPAWRAGLLHMRAKVLQQLGRANEAIGFAEEGLALKLRTADAPGGTLASHRWSLGDLLRKGRRQAEARALYQAVLDDAGSGPHDRIVALSGLGACCRAAKDGAGARAHAEEAVRLAQPMGDEVLSTALEGLTKACLAQEDVPAARLANDRHVEVARRLGGAIDLHFALVRAAKVALLERDGARAGTFLAEAQPHAEALDRARGRYHYRTYLDKLRTKLAKLESAPDPT